MKISKILVATGRGKEVRKMVRNQDEAYIEVWKLCAWKCICSSGSCSFEGEKKNQTDLHNYYCTWLHVFKISLQSVRFVPESCTQTGTCKVPVQPYWVWRALVICSLASTSQTHRKPLPLASRKTTQWDQTSKSVCFSVKHVKLLAGSLSVCVCACGEDQLLPAWVAVLQWMHCLDNSRLHGPPENMPEIRRINVDESQWWPL